MDSELRSYAPFVGAYGLLLLGVARDYSKRGGLVPWLAGLFFVGGIGRAISLLVVGPPHPLFIALMAVELILPFVLVGLWLVTTRRSR